MTRFFDELPSESMSSAEIRVFFSFQEKQAGIKEQPSSNLAARNSLYNDNVVSSDFSFSSFISKQATAG